jgi:hypothetical protein
LATWANIWSGVVVFTVLFITSPTCIGHLRPAAVGTASARVPERGGEGEIRPVAPVSDPNAR